MWHEFILYTRQYEFFCKRAFGAFLHHSPAAVLSSNRRSNAGLRRVWWHDCKEENINPRNASRLPLIFAIDAKLNIADGFRYSVDCQNHPRKHDENTGSTVIYCGGDFGSTGVDGTTDGFGDSSSGDGLWGSFDSGGHGCSGHGCSGGCGGGGCGGD